MGRVTTLTRFVLILCAIGAINWGLVGFFNWNLVNAIFGHGGHGPPSALSRIIYAIVGLCGVALAVVMSRLREVAEERRTLLQPPRSEIRP
jgi:uncharacterized membrane protein YuzA (DUF378 family)